MRSRDGWPGRAALTVVALYGLLLSMFLGAMAPTTLGASAQAGLRPDGVFCSRDGAGPTTPAAPASHGRDCCPAGCAAPSGEPPRLQPVAAPSAPWAAVAHETERPGASSGRYPRYALLPRGPPAI